MLIEIEKITDKVPRKMFAALCGMWILQQTAVMPEITNETIKIAVLICQTVVLCSSIYLHYAKESNGKDPNADPSTEN